MMRRSLLAFVAVWAAADGSCPGARRALDPRDEPRAASMAAPLVFEHPYDPASTGARIDAWPLFEPSVETRSVSSFDRSGGNDDGFGGTYSALSIDARGEHVIFDAEGPGVLRTLWFTGPAGGTSLLRLGLLRFYLDGAPEPRIAIEANALFAGKTAPFTPPLVADNRASTGGYVSFVPIAYARHLRITTEKRAGFYAAHYDTYPRGTHLETFDGTRDDPHLRALFSASASSSAPLEEVPLVAFREGAGTIERIRFQPDHLPRASELQSARIRIRWDGEKAPAIDSPLGIFFGSGLGVARIESIPFSITGTVFENRIPMPFWKGFHLEVTGISGALSLRVGPARFRSGEAGHLHVLHRKVTHAAGGGDHEYLHHAGRGKLIGTVLAIRPKDKKWWEGDMRTRIDGTLSLHGTGHEDDHLAGWSDELLVGPFSLPLHGVPKTEITDRRVPINARASFYRFFPGISFNREIIHSTEHGTENSAAAEYESVAFFYAER